MFDSVRQLMKKTVKEKGIPYLDVVCCREHKEIMRYSVGSPDQNELLYMYSCSKPITVTAAMMLVERGLLSLDDPVEKFIPEYKGILVENDTVTVPCEKKMTIRHLFTMTAGLDYNSFRGNTREIIAKDPCASTEAIVKGFAAEPLKFQPGFQFKYSLCHDVLAVVIEKVSDTKFSRFIKENIFNPLSMNESTFDNKPCRAPADIYECKDDKIIKSVGYRPVTPCYESGGAGLISSVNDYIKFANMLAMGGIAENGQRLISKQTIDLIRSEQIKSISVNNNFTCVQGGDYGYGLGVRTRVKSTDWGLPIGEFGWDGAAGSYLMVDPVNKISVFMGMHLLVWPKCFTGEHLNIVKEIYNNL